VSWKIVSFTNYQSTRFAEEFGDFLVNSEHKFVNLLINEKNILNTEGRRQIVLSFLRQLKGKATNKRFHWIRERQKEILNWFKDAGRIENVEDYLLTEKDFPPPRR
jgi:hypothetical protein